MDLLKRNEGKAQELWKVAYALRGEIEGLGVRDEMGPWSGVPEAGRFALEVLGKWEGREGVGWKRDS